MKTLLYVDDEESIGRVVARYFTRRGDTVLLARSIAEATDILEVENPSAVFIDVWLGTESGFELLDWIEDRRPHLAQRVTFVTGELVDDTASNKTWTALGRPVIQKPFDLSRLASSVDGAEPRAGT
ncbi:MAG: response regulator [Gemmatimonadaceae bacterium]